MSTLPVSVPPLPSFELVAGGVEGPEFHHHSGLTLFGHTYYSLI